MKKVTKSTGQIMKNSKRTYDIVFNDNENSNNKGFSLSLEEAENYIEGNESYFQDYKGGTVSIICNETGETVSETEM